MREFLPTWTELGDPPGFGPYGARPPMRSAECGVEQFLLGPKRPDLPYSPALHLLLSPFSRDPAFAGARRWVAAELAVPFPPVAVPMPSRTAPTQPVPALRRLGRNGTLGVGLVAGAAAGLLPVVASGAAAAYGYRWYKRRQQPAQAPSACAASWIELRRLQHARRWVRDPDIQRLPPGATNEYARTTTVGLSRSTATELGRTIGLEHDFKIAKLNAELNHTLQHELSITEEQEETFTVSITNGEDDVDRHYAMWRIEDRVAVDVLDLNGNTPYWRRQAEVRFHNTSTVCYTMARVRRSNW